MTIMPSEADDLSVQQIRSFCLVYEKQSYSAAARDLELSVPTIWDQVQSLARRYKAVLFEKRGRRIFPTRCGQALYEALRPVLAGLDSTFDLVRDESAHQHTLTLVAGARMMLEELGPPLKRFRDANPHVSLRLLQGDNRSAERLLAEGEADLALALEPGPGLVGSGVTCEALYEIDYLALVPGDHSLAPKKSIRLLDLVAHPLIVGYRGTYGRHLLEQALHRQRLLGRLVVSVETSNSAFTIACVRAGMGIGIVAGRAENVLTRGLTVRSLKNDLGRARVVAMWKSGRQFTRAVRALLDEIAGA